VILSKITVNGGDLEGTTDGHARRFLAIPYAQPPIGDLRWKAPVKAKSWTGVRPAKEFSKRCAQVASIQAAISTDEDCLYLNVWAPDPPPSSPVPVLVWFHGGGNTAGSTADDIPLNVGGKFYDGNSFAAKFNVVVVTTNYRLGVLGFFAHPALRAEGSPSGNQGLLDQQLALKWVYDNVTYFGGDENNLTIFGESAGSQDVCLHMAAPSSASLFQEAISESGGCTTRMRTQAEAEAQMPAFESAVGCSGSSDALACLRGKTPDALLIAAPNVLAPPPAAPPPDGGLGDAGAQDAAAPTPVPAGDAGGLPGGSQYWGTRPLWTFGPVVDKKLLPDQPRALFDAGKINKVPYILGSNSDEGTLFHLNTPPVKDETEYLAALTRRFGYRAHEVLDMYPVADFPSANDALQRVTGDSGLVCGTHDTARRAAAAGVPVYMYNFALPLAVPGAEALGATHGSEIAYVFGDNVKWPDAESEAVSKALQGYWSRFAKAGDPNGGTDTAWPKFTTSSDQRIQFAKTPTTAVITDFRVKQCAFWRTFYDAAFK
jgi:para-nitrobenzyl esterase